jgi:hypothetical protein
MAKVVLVIGAPGDAEFGDAFSQQAAIWKELCQRAGCDLTTIGLSHLTASLIPQGADGRSSEDPNAIPAVTSQITPEAGTAESNPASLPVPEPPTDWQQLKELLEVQPREGMDELWLVFAGHGTFDGKEARFNLSGPDVSATELAEWLQPFERPVVVINTASSSAPFLPKLAGTNRVVVTATRSGYEQNYTRFGTHFAEAIVDPESDLDQDGQTSLLEAYLSAAHRVAEFYKMEGRLATEHSLIDDNGDGLGTPADWFRGLRATKRARDNAPLDGLRAHQLHLLRSPAELALGPEVRARRDEIEREIARLRDAKTEMDQDEYYRRLEVLLLDLARLYAKAASAKAD